MNCCHGHGGGHLECHWHRLLVGGVWTLLSLDKRLLQMWSMWFSGSMELHLSSFQKRYVNVSTLFCIFIGGIFDFWCLMFRRRIRWTHRSRCKEVWLNLWKLHLLQETCAWWIQRGIHGFEFRMEGCNLISYIIKPSVHMQLKTLC